MRATATLTALATLLGGCSLVFDPNDHVNGGSDGGTATRDGSGGPEDAGPPPPVAVNDFCSELVARYCRGHLQCCTSAAAETQDQCETRVYPDCFNLLDAVIRDGRNGYDPDLAGVAMAELDAFIDAPMECDTTVADYLFGFDGFVRVLRGTFSVGTACSGTDVHLACARPAFCVRQGFASWECTTTRNGSGMPCWLDWECQDDLYCLRSGLSGTCAPKLADGMSCTSGFQCQSGVCYGAGDAGVTCVEATSDIVFCANPFTGSFDGT